MQASIQSAMAAGGAAGAAGAGGAGAAGTRHEAGLHLEVQPNHADGAQFKAMFEQHLQRDAMKLQPNTNSLGSALAQRTTNLASEVKQDQMYVSKLLEQATRSGDSMQLMKAMMALNDYQLRVQTISKTVSKASSAVDSLTKLQ